MAKDTTTPPPKAAPGDAAPGDAAPDAVGEALQALRDILFMRPAGPVEKTKSAWKILEAIENRAKAALATVADRRSFPEAGDGRPISNTAAELFGAGCDPETASFVARQLERKGLVLARAETSQGQGGQD